MKRKRLAMVSGVAAFALVAAACTSSAAEETTTSSTAAPQAAITTVAPPTTVEPTTTTEAPPAEPIITIDRFVTADQMLLANEINESGEPFAEALGYNLDDLDPNVAGQPDDTAYVLGIENYEYSRYQLGTIVRNSGLGLHMLWAPLVRKAAAAEPDSYDGSVTGTPNGFKEDDKLMETILAFARFTGETPPANAWPQFAEFVSGDPRLPQAVDPEVFDWQDVATMGWDRSKMEKMLVPSALGQTLMKQYLWASDMLSAFHDANDEGIEADGVVSPDVADGTGFDPENGVFFGGDARDGFIGLVLTAESINKIAFLTNTLAYDGTELGAIDLATYDPAEGIRYFPHAVAVTESPVAEDLPPQASELVVEDSSSRLFDQASLLWGTVSFTNMMNPSDTSDPAHLAYKAVFDGGPFPASMSETGTPGPYDLMKGTSKALFMNIKAMHYDADAKVYVDEAIMEDGAVVRGDTVSAVESAYLLVALEGMVEQFAGTPLEEMARQAVTEQAAFLVANLSDGSGRYAEAATAGGERSGNEAVEAQSAAVRALYVAARITGDTAIADAADEAYTALISGYWVSSDDLFRTVPESDTATYTPRNFAIIAGALREASLEGGDDQAAQIYTGFFQNVGNKMQLAEGAATGETGGDSDGDGIPFVPEQPDGLPPVFAGEAVFTVNG